MLTSVGIAILPNVTLRVADNCSQCWAAMGRSLPVITTAYAAQVECKRLVSTDAIDWSVAM